VLGGLGSDHFIFSPGFDNEIIEDFRFGEGDILDLRAFSIEVSFDEFVFAYSSMQDGGVLFDFGDGDSLFLRNIEMSTMDSHAFLF
jgi:hypothetical protein